MPLVLVRPPPDLVGGGNAGADWQTWVEVPVPVVWANLIPNEPEHLLRVAYYQSTIEGCARPGNQELELDGHDIIVRVTLMQPPPTPWAIPCHEQVVELDTVFWGVRLDREVRQSLITVRLRREYGGLRVSLARTTNPGFWRDLRKATTHKATSQRNIRSTQ